MLNITTGKIDRPKKVVVYGAEGIGKTTFASKFPNPLFIDTEGGTAHMDVRRVEKPDTWDALVDLVGEIANTPGVCETLVLDTADWAEQSCILSVCKKYKKAGIEEFGYGKGYTYVAEEFARLLAACDRVIAAGMHVVITAHAKMRKFEQPDEMGAYDRWEMKLSKQVAPLLKEWCDMLLFCNYKTYVVSTENNGAKKAQGGKRVIYTSHHPCWDAKNRQGLPEEMDLDYSLIAPLFGKSAPAFTPAEPKKSAVDELKELLERDGIKEDELRTIVARKGQYDVLTSITEYSEKFIRSWVIPNWDKIVEIIKNTPDR
ncbi:MAG: ATP-binding protein [Clostridia bacterium]|nr:ATP-binding protein [Clostridia bacterium]